MSRSRSALADSYVAQVGWLVPSGRTDLVDLVADEFERPQVPAAEPAPDDRAGSLRIAS